jgi:hypothetical protein
LGSVASVDAVEADGTDGTSDVNAHLRRASALAAAAVVAALVTAPATPTTAAARSAPLSYATPTASWSESAPMDGQAPMFRNQACASPTHPCDDFTLDVDPGGDEDAQLVIEVAPSAGDELEIAVYPPGCPSGPESSNVTAGCIVVHDATRARIDNPVEGSYLIRLTCDACTAATYTATATLSHLAIDLPAPGDTSPAWAVQQLALKSQGTMFEGEPGISINKLGHVIVNTFGPTVWISTDDGHHWGPAIEGLDPVCTGEAADSDAVVSDDDTYYAVNLCFVGLTNLSYASHDTGKTWNANKGGLPTPPGATADADRQWYALDPSDPAVLYLSFHDLAGPNIWVIKSTDHGETWPQQIPVTLTSSNAPDAASRNLTTRPIVDPTDPKTVLVFYAAGDSSSEPVQVDAFHVPFVYVARSTDGGLTWGENPLVYDAGSGTGGVRSTLGNIFPVATFDAAGNAYVVLSQRDGGQTETHLYLLVLPKGSAATARPKPVRIDQGGLGANVLPWITAGDAGRVAVSWYGSKATDHHDQTAQWSEMAAVSTDALGATPHFTQSRVSGDKPVHVGDICVDGAVCTGDRDLYDFQSIAVDPCGYVQAVWTDDTHNGAVTMHGRQTGGTSLRAAGCPAGFDVVKGGFTGRATGASGGSRLPATGDGSGRARAAVAGLLAASGLGLGLGARRGRRRRHGQEPD